MLTKLLMKEWMYRTANKEKIAREKVKRRLERQRHKEFIISMFGALRYFLSILIGPVALYSFNKKFYYPEPPAEKPYQKFYTSEHVANRYEERLKEKYERVSIEKVYDEHGAHIGFMLYGRGKIVVEQQQPSNVIPFSRAIK